MKITSPPPPQNEFLNETLKISTLPPQKKSWTSLAVFPWKKSRKPYQNHYIPINPMKEHFSL